MKNGGHKSAVFLIDLSLVQLILLEVNVREHCLLSETSLFFATTPTFRGVTPFR